MCAQANFLGFQSYTEISLVRVFIFVYFCVNSWLKSKLNHKLTRKHTNQNNFRITAIFIPLSNENLYIIATIFALSVIIKAAGNHLDYSFSGNGKTDLTIFRPSSGSWYVLSSTTGNFNVVNFGLSGDVPVSSAYTPQ